MGKIIKANSNEINNYNLKEFNTNQQSQQSSDINMLSDITVPVTVELVRFNKLLADLISLQPGNIIELDNSLDEPFDLFANGKKIGTCEVVNIGDKLGIKVVSIESSRGFYK